MMEVALSVLNAMQIYALHLQLKLFKKYFFPATLLACGLFSVVPLSGCLAHTQALCVFTVSVSLSPRQPQTLPQHYVMHGASLGLPGVALDCT